MPWDNILRLIYCFAPFLIIFIDYYYYYYYEVMETIYSLWTYSFCFVPFLLIIIFLTMNLSHLWDNDTICHVCHQALVIEKILCYYIDLNWPITVKYYFLSNYRLDLHETIEIGLWILRCNFHLLLLTNRCHYHGNLNWPMIFNDNFLSNYK